MCHLLKREMEMTMKSNFNKYNTHQSNQEQLQRCAETNVTSKLLQKAQHSAVNKRMLECYFTMGTCADDPVQNDHPGDPKIVTIIPK